MYRIAGYGMVALALVAGCRSAEVQSEPGSTPSLSTMPATGSYLPTGVPIMARLDQTLSTEVSDVGDHFSATVTQPVVARNGEIAVPVGTTVHGTITALDDSDHAADVAYIRLNFDRISLNGRSYPFSAQVMETDVRAAGDTDFDPEAAARGAIAGGILGAVLQGDLEGAITGGAIGAVIGTAISLGTGTVQAALPAGTAIELQSTQAVDLR